MNYQDWLESADHFLEASGKGYNTSQIDSNHLLSSFQQGMNPVVYAKLPIHPMRHVQPQHTAQPAPVRKNLPAMTQKEASNVVNSLSAFAGIFTVGAWGLLGFWGFSFLQLITLRTDAGQIFTIAATSFVSLPFICIGSAFMGIVCRWMEGIFRSLYKSQ